MKKIIMRFLLVCVLAAGAIAGPLGMETVQAEEEVTQWGWVESEDFRYKIKDDGTAEILRYYGKDPAVHIPEKINGRDVTSIGENAFAHGTYYSAYYSLVSIEIPNSVTSIGNSAFAGCESLTSIEIPDSVTSLGNRAFHSSGLTSIKIPSSVTSMGYGVFGGCDGLTSVDMNGLTSIGKATFICCDGLTSIEIPGSVTSIEDSVFNSCKNLTSVEISNGVTSIGHGVFYQCSSLSSIKIPNSVTSIGPTTFDGCGSLVSMEIPGSVTSIGEHAFGSCDSLKDIYYGGSQKQWNQNRAWLEYIEKYSAYEDEDVNWFLGLGIKKYRKTVIHFASSELDDQTITAKNITKTYGAKPFSINAKANTGTALTYAVSDKKVATVDKKGKVTIKGCGITNITITAPATDAYNQAKKTIKLTVKPKKVTLSSVKSTKKKTVTVKWKQDKKAAGYLIQCATDSKFKKNKVQMTVSKNKTVSATVKKLKAGKKYYVRVCAYARSGKTKVQGDWSKVKTVKIKK